MSDERLTKDKREWWRVDLADGHPEACNPWDVEAALDECDTLERERDEARKLAYIGEHHFSDLTYKARLEEVIEDFRAHKAAATRRETDPVDPPGKEDKLPYAYTQPGLHSKRLCDKKNIREHFRVGVGANVALCAYLNVLRGVIREEI